LLLSTIENWDKLVELSLVKFPDGSSMLPASTKLLIFLIKRPSVNNQIRTREVRLIDETGKQTGVIPLQEALRMAEERNLDLIQVTEKAEPPVCKIMDYGKYLYWLQKKEKAAKGSRSSELKGIRLGFNISLHDLETRARQAEKFLKKGDKIRVEMVLRGREKALGDFAKGKINQFLEILEKVIPIKIERELKREPRGFTMIISKGR
jgi:translation initiation factor IF-3